MALNRDAVLQRQSGAQSGAKLGAGAWVWRGRRVDVGHLVER